MVAIEFKQQIKQKIDQMMHRKTLFLITKDAGIFELEKDVHYASSANNFEEAFSESHSSVFDDDDRFQGNGAHSTPASSLNFY